LLANAEQYENVAEAVADCRLVVGTTVGGARRDLQHRLRRLEDGARAIKRQLQTARVALLFGSERYGLSNQELSHCHWVMRIPTREEHGSMNLGQAVAVCLYELVRGRKAASAAKTARGKKEKTPAKSGEIERLLQQLFQVLDTSGYVKPRAAAATEENLRRMLRRMQLDTNDTVLWLGILRQIAWKLRANEKDGE
jgi:tRNA/rRNA methyltransferase